MCIVILAIKLLFGSRLVIRNEMIAGVGSRRSIVQRMYVISYFCIFG